MQTLSEIRQLLAQAGLSPRHRFGQNFLYDKNLLGELVQLAAVDARATVLEVGPGTGSLTEELLSRCGRVVAAEVDRGLCKLLEERLGGRPNFRLVCGDVLAGKHAIAQAVLTEIAPEAELVSNLPYNIATPLIALCLTSSWASLASRGADAPTIPCLFPSMTFTVQQEVAERLCAGEGSAAYGPVSVLAALLARVELGPAAPASAFWPQPKVGSRMVRMVFDEAAALALADVKVLSAAVSLSFNQRRKQIGAVMRRKDSPLPSEAFAAALDEAGIPRTLRAEQISPARFLALANALARQLAG